MKHNFEAKLPRNHWRDLSNQRTFFLQIGKKLGINELDDWKEVTSLQLHKYGGEHILSKYYKGSLSNALKTIFPNHSWDEETFRTVPRRYWQARENQKKFIEKLIKKFKIQEHTDWRKVTIRDVHKLGGRGFLEYFNNSLFNALMDIYPEIDWKNIQLSKAPLGFWKQEENRRKYLENVAKAFNIQNPISWGNLSVNQVANFGGSYPILRYYGGSMYRALSSTFPGIFISYLINSYFLEIQWQKEWFRVQNRFPRNYWENELNQRDFLNKISEEFSIKNPTQWRRVTLSLIRNKGGSGLLEKYNNSLVDALKEVFPGETWEELSQVHSELQASKPQRSVHKFSSKWFPNLQISLNFRHPKLKSLKSQSKIELDVFVHKYQIAFEYNGMQHYRESFNKSLEEQKERDQQRRIECEKAGITLIEVPYWWDESEENLLASLLQARPDLIHVIKSDIIRDEEHLRRLTCEESLAIPKSLKFFDSEFLMLSHNWNTDIDPTGWIVTEKYDGMRGYWDGSDLYSRSGRSLLPPKSLKDKLPQFPLDGELWCGRLAFHVCKRNVMTSDSNLFVFQVFDAPKQQGGYIDRIQYLEKALLSSERIKVTPYSICRGKDHLIEVLEATISEGGEGLMIRNPNAPYITGRSNHLLKVKPMYTEKVVVKKVEEIKKVEGGSHKFCHVEVMNKCGLQFRLNTRVSQIKYPTVKQGGVVTVGFHGLNINGVPKFSVVTQVHENAKWEDVIPYFIDYGSPSTECFGCKKTINKGELRVNVKGAHWIVKQIGYEPIYKQFSFCLDLMCIKIGNENMKSNGILFPKFNDKIAVKAGIDENITVEGVNIVYADDNHLTEDFYVFK